jgi:Rrf2 family protein
VKISTKGRYGTRALLDLAVHSSEQPVSLRDIAGRQEISLPYLEHLIAPLIAGGIIKSVKGPGGGISLVKAPGEINLNEVVQLLEGSIAPAECVNNPDSCKRSSDCVTREVWSEMNQAANGILESITLGDLVEMQKKKTHPELEMYYI